MDSSCNECTDHCNDEDTSISLGVSEETAVDTALILLFLLTGIGFSKLLLLM